MTFSRMELPSGLLFLVCHLTFYVVQGFTTHRRPAIFNIGSLSMLLDSPGAKTTKSTASSLSSLFVRRTKWDDLVDEDEDDGGVGYLKK